VTELITRILGSKARRERRTLELMVNLSNVAGRCRMDLICALLCWCGWMGVVRMEMGGMESELRARRQPRQDADYEAALDSPPTQKQRATARRQVRRGQAVCVCVVNASPGNGKQQ